MFPRKNVTFSQKSSRGGVLTQLPQLQTKEQRLWALRLRANGAPFGGCQAPRHPLRDIRSETSAPRHPLTIELVPVAVRTGFEPAVGFTLQRFSKPSLSTTQPPHQLTLCRIKTMTCSAQDVKDDNAALRGITESRKPESSRTTPGPAKSQRAPGRKDRGNPKDHFSNTSEPWT